MLFTNALELYALTEEHKKKALDWTKHHPPKSKVARRAKVLAILSPTIMLHAMAHGCYGANAPASYFKSDVVAAAQQLRDIAAQAMGSAYALRINDDAIGYIAATLVTRPNVEHCPVIVVAAVAARLWETNQTDPAFQTFVDAIGRAVKILFDPEKTLTLDAIRALVLTALDL